MRGGGITKHLKSKKGFTFIEMLCTIVVLLLASGGMYMGVSLAADVLRESTTRSEAQTLTATLVTAINDELRYAGSFSYDEESRTLTGFFSPNHGRIDDHFFSTDENTGHIMLGTEKLLPDDAYVKNTKATVSVIYKTNQVFFVTLTVTEHDGTLLREETFEVAPLNLPLDD